MPNPALFRMSKTQPITRKHGNCNSKILRFSRIRQGGGRRYMVHVCDKCGYKVEGEIGVLEYA